MPTRLHRRLAEDHGISLVEMLVGLAIVGVAMAAMTSSVFSALASSRAAQDQVDAAQRVNEVMEDLVGRPLAEIAPATHDGVTTPVYEDVTRRGVAYTAVTDVRWVDDPCNGSAAPDVGANDPRMDYLEMRVTVSWTVGSTPRSLDTVMLRAPAPVDDHRPVRSAEC
ncbi:MAG: type II secretion system protein [Egibacteraceae bacterium]